MSKEPVSVTLDRDNILWLRARMRLLRRRSLSDMIDSIVAEARAQYGRTSESRRSVVGTITISPDDPDLAGADDAIREMFTRSLDAFDAGERPKPRRATARRTKSSASRAKAKRKPRG